MTLTQMQEEISERTIALWEKGTKFTLEMLEKMMREYINFTKNDVKKAIDKNKEKNIILHGKMTIEELVKQNRGAQAMVIDDIGDWNLVATLLFAMTLLGTLTDTMQTDMFWKSMGLSFAVFITPFIAERIMLRIIDLRFLVWEIITM